jgi:hypothetical protein
LKGKESREVPVLTRDYSNFCTNLIEHHCDSNKPGGFVERLQRERIKSRARTRGARDARNRLASATAQKSLQRPTKDDSKSVMKHTPVETTRYLMPVAAELVEALLRKIHLLRRKCEAKHIAV